MKKISKIILTIVLLFTFSLNVKAVTITTDNTKQGTVDTNSYLVTNKGDITINNIESDTFKGYKIIDFYYNSTTDTLSYEFTSNFKIYEDVNIQNNISLCNYYTIEHNINDQKSINKNSIKENPNNFSNKNLIKENSNNFQIITNNIKVSKTNYPQILILWMEKVN